MTTLRSFANAPAPTAIGTTSVCPVPTGTVNGDLLLMFSANSGPGAYTNPTGWTLIQSQTKDGASDVEGACWYRIASSEPASYTLTETTGSTTIITVMACYTGGINSASPIRSSGVIASGATAVSTSPTPVLLSTVGASDTVVIFYAYGDNASGATPTMTYPTTGGWTRQIAFGPVLISGHFATAIGMIDQVDGTARPTASSSATGGWAVFSVAIANLPSNAPRLRVINFGAVQGASGY